MQAPLKLVFGDVVLDEARFEVRRGGRAVGVQPKALELVFYLARHRHRVVTKEELLATVWGGVVVTEASLNQALSLARRALGDSGEAQTAIRTVRSKGFQFVAEELASERGSAPPQPAARPRDVAVDTEMETAQGPDLAEPGAVARYTPRLTAIIHCDAPSTGGASWSLDGVDEVEIGRASQRRAARTAGVTRLLRIGVPGRLMSREHARLVRTPEGWLVVDAGARNGVRLNGRRVDRARITPGDRIEAGNSIFGFTLAAPGGDLPRSDSGAALLDTVSPELDAAVDRLRRVAETDLSVLLLGEHGSGKASLAERLHLRSGRSGPLVSLDARTLPADFAREPLAASVAASARGGTLLLRNVEGLSAIPAARVAALVDAGLDLRVVSTSSLTLQALTTALGDEIATRLAGYVFDVPALRTRTNDLGVLIAHLLAGSSQHLRFDPRAAELMLSWSWPGNVRELAQRLKVVAAIGAGEVGVETLPAEMRATS